ncbi:MAG TPA: DUF1015 family protein [Syntrophales bacterium]|nr:DUF1015 family protein [Syntrophales bacterium]HOL58633.1 DUF1015 family protein [Syntrophales bacterium]HPO35079.1 DUF1015 family protein [Syntrophales bacterium]
MDLIKPFRALRPQPAYAALVAAPPYDVLTEEEARAFARGNPLCFLRVEKSEIDLPPGVTHSDEAIFERARENLQRLREEGILFQDEAPCYYVYGQQTQDHRQFGIMALASVRAYEEGLIKRHEFTRQDKEEERIRHVEAVGAHTGPVFLIYKNEGTLDKLFLRVIKEPPEYTFTTPDRVVHRVWKIEKTGDVEGVTRFFARLDGLYIADGHHRAAAAAAVARKYPENKEAAYFLAALFPHNQLNIMAYNRAVRDLNGLTEEGLLEKIRENFSVVRDYNARIPQEKHEFGLYLKSRWFRLRAKAHIIDDSDLIRSLDVSILQERILAPILGISDPRTDKRIDFIGGIRGPEMLEKLVDSGEFSIAFSLYPVNVEDLMAIADRGFVMPPKSTWFEPKLLSGLFVHLLD